MLADELTRAAWMYIGQEADVSHQMNDLQGVLTPEIPGGSTRQEEDFPNAVPYSIGEELALNPPQHEDPDIRALVDDVGGSIKVVDEAISAITTGSPVSEILEPMPGNWTELERSAKVLVQAGNGAETLASNLTSPLSKLDEHWDGSAASEFMEYAQRLGTGIGQECPLNRLVVRVYQAVAAEFENAAQFMVSTLNKTVDKIVEDASTSWSPGYGWVKIIQAVRTAIEIIEEAQELIESLRDLVRSVHTAVEAAQHPVEFVKGEIEEKLEPIKEKIDEGGAAFNLGKDIGDLASEPDAFEEILQGADEDYSVGESPRRPAED